MSAQGAAIDIDGMGSFEPDEKQRIVFKATGKGRVFLAYAQEDPPNEEDLFGAP